MGFTLLVTGFGPFPQVHDNPTARVARRVEGARWGPVRVRGAVLPTEWASAGPYLDRVVTEIAPDALVMLGVAGRDHIEVERVARNITIPRPDAIGAMPATMCLDADGPDECETTLPWAALGEAGAGISDDAGQYLCNAVFYRALRRYDGIPQRGFVHIPHAGVDATLAFLERAAAILAGISPADAS